MSTKRINKPESKSPAKVPRSKEGLTALAEVENLKSVFLNRAEPAVVRINQAIQAIKKSSSFVALGTKGDELKQSCDELIYALARYRDDYRSSFGSLANPDEQTRHRIALTGGEKR